MSGAPAMRRALVRLIVGVVLLDAACIAAWYALHVATWPARRQQLFVGVWMIATLGVVLPGLMRVRAARSRARAERLRGR